MAFVRNSMIHDAAVTASKIAAGAVTQVKLAAGSLYGLVAGNVTPSVAGAIAAAGVGLPVVVPLSLVDAASGNQDFTALPYKMRVMLVVVHKTSAGNAGNSVTIHNGTTGNAITSAITLNTADVVTVAPSLANAYIDIAAAATIRAVTVKAGGDNSARVYLVGIRIA